MAARVLQKPLVQSMFWKKKPLNHSLRLFSSGSSSEEQHRLFQQQMQQLKEEREALFGFTDEDQNAWTNAADHKHDSSFLEAVDQARTDTQEENFQNETEVQSSALKQESSEGQGHAGLSHLTADGKSVHMVDIGAKKATKRVAVAQSKVIFPPEVLKAFDATKDNDDLVGPKGPIFATARLAGIMAAKKTSELIPLCHPLPLDQVTVDIQLKDGSTAVVTCECRVTHKTGVEMEALTGASIAALTIYDMVKAVSHRIRIEQTKLVRKEGGKRTVHDEKTE